MISPPMKAPRMVSQMPITLLAMPTSSCENPMPLIRKGVVRLPAKASPSL